MFFIDPNAAKIRLNKPNVVTKEGNIATLAVYVSGYPQPDVYWRKGRRDIDVRKGKYKTLSDGSLQVYTLDVFFGQASTFLKDSTAFVYCLWTRGLLNKSFR